MATKNKLEEHIRDTFHKREITPSDRAWDQLSAELEDQRSKGTKGFFWVAAAAVLIGLLVGSSIYLNTVRFPEIDEIKVVEAPVSGTKAETDTIIGVANVDRVEKVDRDIRSKPEMKREIKEIAKERVSNPFVEKTEPEVVALDSRTEILETEKTMEVAKDIINSKIDEVIAQVALLEQGNAHITDAEVDSLLLQAQRELFADSIFRDDRSVDAMALLADVEGELDRSFREQLFDLLKEGYFRAKTAVAARNN